MLWRQIKTASPAWPAAGQRTAHTAVAGRCCAWWPSRKYAWAYGTFRWLRWLKRWSFTDIVDQPSSRPSGTAPPRSALGRPGRRRHRAGSCSGGIAWAHNHLAGCRRATGRNRRGGESARTDTTGVTADTSPQAATLQAYRPASLLTSSIAMNVRRRSTIFLSPPRVHDTRRDSRRPAPP